MTDCEMLELAAKAAGWDGWRSKHGYWNLTAPDGKKSSHCHYWVPYDSYSGEKLPGPTFADAIVDAGWNPLDDDGDALRLAVKLGMNVCFGANYVIANGSVQMPTVNNADNPYAATRRAIVHAAAEIGKKMEKPCKS